MGSAKGFADFSNSERNDMKLSKIAMALTLALSAPAFAATSNVDISGTIDMSVSSIDGKSDPLATENERATNVSSNNSNLVLKGSEDLGGGAKAIWQVQTYFSAGGTDSKGSANGQLSNGDTFLGISSASLGTLSLGNMDSPVKKLGRKADLFSNRLADSRNLTQETYGDVRLQNSVAYASPAVMGFSAAAAYSSNVSSTAAMEADADMYSLSASYESGPAMAGVGYESRDLAVGEDPSMLRLVGGYSFGDAKVTALWQRAYDTTAAVGADDDRDVWGIGGAYRMGAATLKAQYYSAGELGGVADSGADMWAIGADYSLSKRTTVYATYAQTSNDSAAAFSVSGGGHGDNMGSVMGETTSGVQMGVAHSF